MVFEFFTWNCTFQTLYFQSESSQISQSDLILESWIGFQLNFKKSTMREIPKHFPKYSVDSNQIAQTYLKQRYLIITVEESYSYLNYRKFSGI